LVRLAYVKAMLVIPVQ